MCRRINCIKIIFLSFVLVSLCQPAPFALADANSPQGPYTLVCKFTVGQVRKYALAVDVDQVAIVAGVKQPMTVHIDMTTTSTVKSIDPADASATMQMDFATLDGTANGQPLPDAALSSIKIPTMIMTMLPNGKIKSVLTADGKKPTAGLTDPSTWMTATIMPEKPINIGDKWSSAIPFMGNTIMSMASSLDSVETVNGDTLAHIETQTSSSIPPAGAAATPAAPDMPNVKVNSLSGETMTTFDISMGAATIVKSKTTMDMTIQSPPPAAGQTAAAPTNMDMTTSLLMTLLPSTT